MLKNKAWIVALLAALTMVFFGCIEPSLKLDDGSFVPPSDDLEIDGADLNIIAVGSNSSAVTVDKNKINIKGTTSAGFFIEFPADAKDYNEFIVYFKVLEIKKPYVGLLMKKNTSMANIPGIGDSDQEYQLKEEDFEFEVDMEFNTSSRISGEVAGKEAITSSKIGKILKKDLFEGGICFQHQAWNPGGNTDVDYTIEVVAMVFPGGGEAPILPPEYVGDPKKVVYTKNAAGVETVEDNDPSVLGAVGMTISSTGVVSMGKGSSLSYNFPTSALDGTEAIDIDIEKDWDYVDIVYTISNVDKKSGGAGNFKARIFQADGSTAYGYGFGGYQDLGPEAENVSRKIQTWGSGGKGGFVIGYNDYDIASSGADSLDIKISKVTFTKGTRYKVQFFAPQTPALNNIATVTVLGGNGLEGDYPKLANKGWTFKGWYDKWDEVSATADSTGKLYTASTKVEANTNLYADWLLKQPDEVSITPTGNSAFPANVEGGNGPTFTASDGKEWFVVAMKTYGGSADQPDFDYNADGSGVAGGTGAQQYPSEIRAQFSAIDSDYDAFDTVKITILARELTAAELTDKGWKSSGEGALNVVTKPRTAQYGAGSGINYPEWDGDAKGTEKTFTYSMSEFVGKGGTWDGFIIAFNDWKWTDDDKVSPFIVRVTKVEFLYD